MDNKMKIEVVADTQQAIRDLLSITNSVQRLGKAAIIADKESTYLSTQQSLNQVYEKVGRTKSEIDSLERSVIELKKTSQTGVLRLSDEFQETLRPIDTIKTALQSLSDSMANVGKITANEFKDVFSSIQKIQNQLQKPPKKIVELEPQVKQEIDSITQTIQQLGIEVNTSNKEVIKFVKNSTDSFKILKTVINTAFITLKSGLSLVRVVTSDLIEENKELVATLKKAAIATTILTFNLIRLFGATRLVKTGMAIFNKVGGLDGLNAIKDVIGTSINLFQYFSQVFGNIVSAVRRSSSIILLTAGAIVASIVKVVSNVQEVNTRILGLSSNINEYTETQSYLSRTATKLSSDIITLSNSYTRLLNLEKSGIITTDESRKMLEGFSNLAMKTGATSDQLGSAMYGLAQGLSAGVLRAEEFNQVMEPLPGLLQELDKASGVGSGGFRKLVNDGKITSELFKDTLIVALASYDGAASRTAGNIVPTFTRMKNTLTNLQASFERPVTNSLVPLMNGMSSIFEGFKQGVDNSINQGGGLLQFIVALSNRISAYLIKIGAVLPQAIGMIDFSSLINQINGIIDILVDLTGEETFMGITLGIDLTKPEGLAKVLQTIIDLTSTGIMVFKQYLAGFSGISVGLKGTAEAADNFSGLFNILLGVGARIEGVVQSIELFGQILQPLGYLLGAGIFAVMIPILGRYFSTFQHGAKIMFGVRLAMSTLFPVSSLLYNAFAGIYFLLTKVIWNLTRYIVVSLASRVATSAFVVALKAQFVAMKAMSAIDLAGTFGKLGLVIGLLAGTALLGTWASENVAAIKWVKDALSGLIEKVFGLGNTGAADEQMVSMVEDLRAKTNDTSITVENYREKLRAYLAEEKRAGEAKVETGKKADKLKETYKNLGVKVKESAEDIKAMYATLTEMTGASFEMRFSLISEGDPNAIKQTIALEEEKFLTMQALIQRDEDKRTLSIHNNVKLEESKVQRLKAIEEEIAAHKSQVEGEKLRETQARTLYEMSVESAKGKKISDSEQRVLESQKDAAAKATQIASQREGKIKSLESERGNILEEKAKKNADAEKQLQSLTEETLMSRINLTRQTLGQALQAYQQYAQKVKEIEQAISEEKKRQSEVLKGIDEKANDAAKKGMENLFKKQLEQGNTNAAYETSKNLELKAAQEIASKKAEFAEMSSQIEQAMQAKNFAKAVEIAKAQEQLGLTISEKQLSAKEAEIQRMVELGQLSEENAARELAAAGTYAQTDSKAMVLEAQERINAAMSQEKTIAQENADAQLGLVENLNTSFKALLEQFTKSKEGTALDVRFIPDSQEIDAFIAKMKGEKIDVAVNPVTNADAIGVSQNAGGMSFAELKGDQQEGLMNVSLKPNSEELDAYLQAKQEQGLNVKLMPDSAQVDSLINRLKEPTTSTHTITVTKEGVTAATGGLIKGPGTTTSDSIPAWLSNREYVIPAKSVDYFGVDFFHSLRSLQMPRFGFATGGLATAAGPQTFMNQITNITNERDLNPIQVNVGDHKIPLYGRTESAKALRTALRDLKRG